MPRRKYLDNAIPADNTAQIGKQQVNRARSARYPKVVPTFSQGSKVPSEFTRTPEAAVNAHRQRSKYYFSQAPTLSNLLHGVVDYLKGNGYATPTLSAQQYGVAPGVGIGKSSPLRRLVKTDVIRSSVNRRISNTTSSYTLPSRINVTDPKLITDQATSYINTGNAEDWFKQLYGPFNRQVYYSLPNDVIKEYNEVILPRLVNARLVQNRIDLKKSLSKNYNFINDVVEAERDNIKRMYGIANYDDGYIVADKKLWDLYNALDKGNVNGYRDVINNVIAVSDNYPERLNEILGHEFRHKTDEYFMRTRLMQKLLDKAYGGKFLSIPRRYEGYSDYYNMRPEQVTMNRDLRHAILNRIGYTPDLLKQNEIIQNISPRDIIDIMGDVSGYGSAYKQDIIDFINVWSNVEDKEAALKLVTDAIRNAMKYVGAGTGATTIGHGIYNSYDRNNK